MRYILLFLSLAVTIISCKEVVVDEKLADFPLHEWPKNIRAVVRYDIPDSVDYQLYFVMRHTYQFPYNKLLAKLEIQDSAKHILSSYDLTIPLTDSSGNWAGDVMDDLYYQRIKVLQPVHLTPGIHRFVLEHQMRDSTLPYILNAGIALERIDNTPPR